MLEKLLKQSIDVRKFPNEDCMLAAYKFEQI